MVGVDGVDGGGRHAKHQSVVAPCHLGFVSSSERPSVIQNVVLTCDPHNAVRAATIAIANLCGYSGVDLSVLSPEGAFALITFHCNFVSFFPPSVKLREATAARSRPSLPHRLATSFHAPRARAEDI